MSNPSKKKGTQYEVDVVEYLIAAGFDKCERRALRGTKDAGDLAGMPFPHELKNQVAMNLSGWLDEARKAAIGTGEYRHALIHKRRGKNVKDSYVTMPLWVYADLLMSSKFGPV